MIETLSGILETAAKTYGNKNAVIDRNETISYGKLLDFCSNFAYFLNRIGLKKGDRVCINLNKDINHVIALFGTWQSGGVAIPLQPQARSLQIDHILGDSAAKVLITTPSNYRLFFKNKTNANSLRTIILSKNTKSDVNEKHTLFFDPRQFNLADFDEGNLPKIHERDLSTILYTSGSTGKPKGVVLSHYNIVSGTRNVANYLSLTESDRILGLLNFSFDYGLNQLTSAFFCGAQIVLYDYLFTKSLIEVINKYQITGVAGVSTTWIQFANFHSTDIDFPNLRYITNSGGSIPPKLIRELQRKLPSVQIFLMYGFTEAFRSTFLSPDSVDKYPESIGKAVPGQEIYVVDNNNNPVPPGEIGELVHRGSHVSLGYWNNPAASYKVFRTNPFQPDTIFLSEIVAYSGDLVRMNNDGFLFYVGRNDEMIKSSGYRISPTEVEECIYDLQDVGEVVAMGLPHIELGHTIAVIVVPSSGSTLSSDDVKQHCLKHLPPYMVPHTIEIWDQLIYNSNNKPDRPNLKKCLLSNAKCRQEIQ